MDFMIKANATSPGPAGSSGASDAARQSTVAPTVDNYSKSLERRVPEEKKLQIVSFFLDAREYAFELTDAVEVLRARTFTEVPRTPDFIKGILSVRGDMVPVMDTKMRLSESRFCAVHSARILVTSVAGLKVGFLVDRMGSVREVAQASIDLFEDGFVKGLIQSAGGPILLLDLCRLIDFN